MHHNFTELSGKFEVKAKERLIHSTKLDCAVNFFFYAGPPPWAQLLKAVVPDVHRLLSPLSDDPNWQKPLTSEWSAVNLFKDGTTHNILGLIESHNESLFYFLLSFPYQVLHDGRFKHSQLL